MPPTVIDINVDTFPAPHHSAAKYKHVTAQNSDTQIPRLLYRTTTRAFVMWYSEATGLSKVDRKDVYNPSYL